MKQFISILLVVLFLASCGTNKNVSSNISNQDTDTIKTKRLTYNRILKSTDYDLKYNKAQEYYDRGKYLKAQDLYEQLIPHERGHDRGAEVYFMYAMSNFKSGDYLYAGYHFESFFKTYPSTIYAEQSLFMSAYCYYLDSPRPTLDQRPTTDAITQFQLFLSKFPDSELSDSCNFLVDTLRHKLEEKSFLSAKLYFDLGFFRSADIALSNSMKDYPDSPFAEETLFYVIKSNKKYADGSIRKKQKERYSNTIINCKKYIQKYPNGLYLEDVERIHLSSDKKMSKFNTKNQTL